MAIDDKDRERRIVHSLSRAWSRAIMREFASGGLTEPGALRDQRGLDAGTRGDLDGLEFDPARLGEITNVHAWLDASGTSRTTSSVQPASTTMPLLEFIADAPARQQMLLELGRYLPAEASQVLGVELRVKHAWTAALMPRPCRIVLGPYPPGSGPELGEYELVVEMAWRSLQTDLLNEAGFRRRFCVASRRATEFYHRLVDKPGANYSRTDAPNLIGTHLRFKLDELVARHRLICPSDRYRRHYCTGYLCMARECLARGKVALAAELFTTALGDCWNVGGIQQPRGATQTIFTFDTQDAASALGGRGRALMRVLMRDKAIWREIEARRARSFMRHSLEAHEGLACWREIDSARSLAAKEVVSLLPDEPWRRPEEIRSDYLSRHPTNPYRRGLEHLEAIAGQSGSQLFAGGLLEEILFGPAKTIAAWTPPAALNIDGGATAWYLPNIRLKRLAAATIAPSEDMETILREVHYVIDGADAGISNLVDSCFNYTLVATLTEGR